MFRLLPWSSVVGGNKVTAEEVKMLAAQRGSPIMETPSLHKLKRKRTNSGTESDAAMRDHVAAASKVEPCPVSHENSMDAVVVSQPKAKDAKVDGAEKAVASASSVTQQSSSSASPRPHNGGQSSPPNGGQEESTSGPVPSHKMDPATLRQTVESQLSIEILLKHDELRLIDQEIAKCQVALDQLRRCTEIPYPGSTASGMSGSLSSGVGPAVLPPGNGRAPISPSPWGVTDGPYSRHYAKWLIPDPRFDGGDVEPVQAPAGAGKAPLDARTTRGSWPETSAFTGSLRSQRSSAGAKLQALSTGYPQPKDKAGPMIIKRKSDGQLVKLVCLDCRRDNFSSTQGFINHCRIAHNRNFASHDAAAAASGEPVEVDEAGMVIGNNNDTSGGAPAGYVHPLIRSAHAIGSTQKSTPRRGSPQSFSKKSSNGAWAHDSQHGTPQTITPLPTQQPSMVDGAVRAPSNSFKASPDAPHLSALLERRGMSLDLLDIVDDAKTKAELDMYSSDEGSGEEMEDTNTTLDPGQNRSTRLPARTVVSPSHPPRPSSQKGKDKSSRKPHSPVAFQTSTSDRSYRLAYPSTTRTHNTDAKEPNGDVDMIDPLAPDYSPNTVESNQAPSLVSDDGDYEVRSDSESPSPSSSESSVDERAFDNIEVRDGDDGGSAGTTSTTEGKPAAPDMPSPAHHPSPVPSRTHKKKGTTKGKRGADDTGGASKDPKRVSFVSPVSTPAKARKDGTKKQRRT